MVQPGGGGLYGSDTFTEDFCPKPQQQTRHSGPARAAQWLSVDPRTRRSELDSRSGHLPGLWARALAEGVQEAADPCFSLIMDVPPSPSPFVSEIIKNPTTSGLGDDGD